MSTLHDFTLHYYVISYFTRRNSVVHPLGACENLQVFYSCILLSVHSPVSLAYLLPPLALSHSSRFTLFCYRSRDMSSSQPIPIISSTGANSMRPQDPPTAFFQPAIASSLPAGRDHLHRIVSGQHRSPFTPAVGKTIDCDRQDRVMHSPVQAHHLSATPLFQSSYALEPTQVHEDVTMSSDVEATSWPPRLDLEILSRSARRWVDSGRVSRPEASSMFDTDFSQVASAADTVLDAIRSGRAGVERPPRESVSGTYFLKRVESRPSFRSGPAVTAVFKPADEEPGDSSPTGSFVSSPSPVHPRVSPDGHDIVHSARLLSAGFRPGEGAFKEVAVYLLDHHNFAQVPQTALARCTLGESGTNQLRTKMGAFQVYVPNEGDADDWGPGIFPRESVHRIAVLDIRTLNYDRHGGNILVTKRDSKHDLVPIDHAFTLPETVQAVPWAVWMDWPAARQPMSKETLTYISNLDPNSEARILRDELGETIRPGCLRSLKIATCLLQKGAAAGLSLYDIGSLMYTRDPDDAFPRAKSVLEKIVDEALESSLQRQSHLHDPFCSMDGLFSMDAAPPRSPSPVSSEDHNETYIVKYAARRIDEHIASIVDSKEPRGSPKSFLGRARSIPDFGFGLGASAASALCATAPPSPCVRDRVYNHLKFVPSPPRRSDSTDHGGRSSDALLENSAKIANVLSQNGRSLVVPVPVPSTGVNMRSDMRPPKMAISSVERKSSPVSPPGFKLDSFS